MDEVKRFVEVDVAKVALDVFIGSSGTAFSVANDEVGIRELLRQLTSGDFVILEATGGLGIPVATALATAGLAVAIVNSRQVRDFARATGRLGIDPGFWPAVEGILSGGDSHLLLLGNPVTTAGYFYEVFGRNRALWKTFSISSFDTPNLSGLTLEQLLSMPDEALDEHAAPYLVTRRWVKERHVEWWNGSAENSPLWQARVMGEFPSAASNTLIPLDWLEHARRAPNDIGGELIVGIDPAGPGRDKTAAVACADGTMVDSASWTDADARGPVLAWLKRWQSRVRVVRYDSAGLGYFFAEPLRQAGYRCIGINVASAPQDSERFTNARPKCSGASASASKRARLLDSPMKCSPNWPRSRG